MPGLELVELPDGVLLEEDFVIALEVDHHRLQHALLATMDGADHASPRRGVDHPWGFLVGEQWLTELDPVPHLHVHGRLHAVIVEADDGDAANRAPCLDSLVRFPCHRQVQPSLDSDHRFRLKQKYFPAQRWLKGQLRARRCLVRIC
ncbi:hypothetical protein D3C84_796530 [compost metagenome]